MSRMRASNREIATGLWPPIFTVVLLLAPALATASVTSPPPWFPFRNTSLPIAQRVADLVGRLTLSEKVEQMTRGGAAANSPAPGIDRLGVAPHIWGTECASGLGSDDSSFAGTSWPQPLGQAATWDTNLVRAVAVASHVELRAQHNEDMRNGVVKYHHGLNCWSPVVNIMRHWAWGRNDETYGECPVLSSAFANAFVSGLQGDDPRWVAATAGCKHLVVHGGPDQLRQTFDANVTLRDWATTFMPAFEACVEAGALGMMCSFNSIRGVPACANHRSMTTWIKNVDGFKGYIVSDQGAAYGIMTDHKYVSTLAEAAAVAVRGGLDLEDANDESHVAFAGIPDAITQGLLSEKDDIDSAVSRLFYVRMRTGEFDPPEVQPYRNISVDNIRSESHLALTHEVAAKSFVLLENHNNTLPLDALTKKGGLEVAVIGPFGDCQSCYFGKYSPHMDVSATTTVADGVKAVVSAANGRVTVTSGCTGGKSSEPYMCPSVDNTSVVTAVAGADVVLLAVGLGSGVESEGKDREAMGLALPGRQDELVAATLDAAAGHGVPVVALLFVAGPVNPSLFDRASAIVDCFYPAESAGSAVADVLFGKVIPAGRLPFSWPTLASDVPPEADYTMVNRTYRYGQPNVRWPFGHGRSYANFDYGVPTLSTTSIAAPSCAGFNVTVAVSRRSKAVHKSNGITNVAVEPAGPADEVVQAYVRWMSTDPTVPTPELSLAAFARIEVPAEGSVDVSLMVEPRDFAVLTDPQCGVVPPRPGVRLSGPAYKVLHDVATAAACCTLCASEERCEAYTHVATNATCELRTAWTLTVPGDPAVVVSGEPLSRWVLRPAVIEVSIGGSSAERHIAGTVTITGAETPLSHCPSTSHQLG